MTATLVQSAADTTGTATFGVNTTIGNCLVACVQALGSSHISAVTTGSSSDHWSSLQEVSGGSQVIAIWVDPASTVSKATVTFTASGASQLNIQAYEFASMGTAPALDGTPATDLVTTTPNSTSWSSGSVSAANGTDVWIGMFGGVGPSGYSVTGPASGWNIPGGTTGRFSGFSETQMVSGYEIPGSAGSVNFSGTASLTTAKYAVIALALTPGSGGGGGGGGSSTGSFLPFFS